MEPEPKEEKNTGDGKGTKKTKNITIGIEPRIIAFINGKSGGQQGEDVKKMLKKHLPHEQVFDLSEGGPSAGLKAWQEHAENLTVIACGGDGTVGWVLSTLDKLGWEVWPAVAVLPLGTGNDMSRVLRWGKGYKGENLLPFLQNVSQSKVAIPFDRWMVNIRTLGKEEVDTYKKLVKETNKGDKVDTLSSSSTSLSNVTTTTTTTTTSTNNNNNNNTNNNDNNNENTTTTTTVTTGEKEIIIETGDGQTLKIVEVDGEKDRVSSEKLSTSVEIKKEVEVEEKDFSWVMNNYFSIGIDSQVCLDFHNMREDHPGLFKSKFVNFGWYGMLSMKRGVVEWQNIAKIAYLEVDDQPIALSTKYMALVILNIPSYAGGTDLWGVGHHHGNQTVCDGRFEVVGIRGISHMGLMQSKMSSGGEHIAQGKKIKMILLNAMAIQIDGEAWMKQPSEITIYHQNVAKLLVNKAKDKKDRAENRLMKVGNQIISS